MSKSNLKKTITVLTPEGTGAEEVMKQFTKYLNMGKTFSDMAYFRRHYPNLKHTPNELSVTIDIKVVGEGKFEVDQAKKEAKKKKAKVLRDALIKKKKDALKQQSENADKEDTDEELDKSLRDTISQLSVAIDEHDEATEKLFTADELEERAAEGRKAKVSLDKYRNEVNAKANADSNRK